MMKTVEIGYAYYQGYLQLWDTFYVYDIPGKNYEEIELNALEKSYKSLETIMLRTAHVWVNGVYDQEDFDEL
jgi:hypothetical protein